MQILFAMGAIIGFFIFAVLVIQVVFNAEIDELRRKDKRYYYRKYLYHKKQAKRAYKKYLTLNNRGGGDNVKSRRR